MPDAEEINQAAWEAMTAWEGAPPSYAETWGLLTNHSLPAGIIEAARDRSKPFLRKLENVVGTMEPTKAWNNRFANLVSGRFSELLFQRAYRPVLEGLGLRLTETTAARDWLDFKIEHEDEGFVLGINVKNAGVQFAKSDKFVGLEPADTLPIATYKIFGSTAKAGHMPLLYVYLVDWGLLARLRPTYWKALSETERAIFRLMTSFKGLPYDFQDRFIECTVGERLTSISAGVGYGEDVKPPLPFYAISGLRCQAIFYRNHTRSPYVYVDKMNTDPNVHVSVKEDTTPFDALIDEWLRTPAARQALLDDLAQTADMEVPNPSV